jgi:putative ABC transport system permease protein
MRVWHILQSRLRSVFFRDRRESDLSEELQFHLERETERLQASGIPRDAARLQALRSFGGAEQIKEECRDARGTTFIDDAIRDVRYALRGFRRTPLVAFAIVGTVALGLGLVVVAFTFLNAFLFNVDRVPNVHEMFAVERPRTAEGEPMLFTRAQFDTLRRETTVFTDAYAESDIDSRLDGRPSEGTLVTGNFFQVLGVSAAMGRTLTPADDEPFAGRPVMVLSDRGWDKLFARDPVILGRTVLVNGVTFEIVGVMPKQFRGLTVSPGDYWAPLSMIGRMRPVDQGREADVGVRVIGRLKPDVSRQTAQAALSAWASAGQPNATPVERAAASITLVPRRGTVDQPHEAALVTAPLFFAFGLILLIACANVTNLLLARAVARQREIGIRLSLGAARSRIVRQLLTESLLLALVAAAAGFAISRVVLAASIDAVMKSFPPDFGDIRLMVPDADWRVLVFLLVGAGVSTMFFGLIPALQATRIEPVRTMRGEVVRDARPGRARDVLIGVQVAASALLLICAAVFLRSAFAVTTEDPGIRTSDTVVVSVANERYRTAIVEAVTSEPAVAAVSASWPVVAVAARGAVAEAVGIRANVTYQFASPEYFGVLGIAVVRGRAFMAHERTSTLGVAVVSETTARTLWPDGEAVGQVVRLDREPASQTPGAGEPALESRTFTVLGVVRDVPGFRVAPFPKAVVYVPTSAAIPGTALIVRVYGDPDLTRQQLLNRLAAIDSSLTHVDTFTLRWVTRMQAYFLQLGFWIAIGLGALALALTLSGLFSVLSYLVEQRTREIGVRMALGATTQDVARLVLSQSFRPVAGGLVLGSVAAASLSAFLLATAGAGSISRVVQVLDPVAYGTSLLIIMTACLAAASIPATRAARLDPTRTLRQE